MQIPDMIPDVDVFLGMAPEELGGPFLLMKANDLVWRYVVSSWLMGKPPEPFDLLAWNADGTPVLRMYELERNGFERKWTAFFNALGGFSRTLGVTMNSNVLTNDVPRAARRRAARGSISVMSRSKPTTA